MDAIILKIGDKFKIDGESVVNGYKDQIDLIAVDHTITMPMTADKSGNSRTTGRCVHGDIVVEKYLDKASAKLLEACSKGTDLGTIEIINARNLEGSTQVFWKVVMTHVYVSSVKYSSNRSQDLPHENVTFNYEQINWTYNQYDNTGASKGSVSAGWNTATNQAG